MMDVTDAKKVIENLQTRPFICGENFIELDNGYIIHRKGTEVKTINSNKEMEYCAITGKICNDPDGQFGCCEKFEESEYYSHYKGHMMRVRGCACKYLTHCITED